MTASPVTVRDSVPFTASISPEQAAAYVRRKRPTWREKSNSVWTHFTDPVSPDIGVEVPMMAHARDYSRRMAELCDALVALGCADRPSEVLLGMGEERP